MTREQAAQLVAILVGHYPSAKFTRENAQAWTDALQELDAERTHEAVKRLVRTEKWMPSLAHIFELVIPPKRELAAPYHGLFESGPVPELPPNVRALSKAALRALPSKARGTGLSAEQSKALMVLEEAEFADELSEEQQAALQALRAVQGQR